MANVKKRPNTDKGAVVEERVARYWATGFILIIMAIALVAYNKCNYIICLPNTLNWNILAFAFLTIAIFPLIIGTVIYAKE